MKKAASKPLLLKETLFIFFIFAGSFSLQAQNGQGGIWHFGAYAGLNFCNGTPFPVTNGALTTNEGCATISDANCNLMFYTDGVTVWNSLHLPMANSLAASPGGSLHGNSSSTQSGVIVPKPLNPDIYYIFTVDDNMGTNGCKYSVVDMTLNGGYGDVIPGQKNILLFTPSSEKITAVNHSNGYDIWVITHPWGVNYFFTYLVTANGVNHTPVISYVGSTYTGGTPVTRGYLKASPEGNYVVAGIEGLDKYELFNFNNSTGQLTLKLSMPANYPDAYGVEFSPDGNFLYGSRRWGTPVYQWNISSGNPAQIMSTQTQIATLSTAYGGALQLAIDNKIYLARSGQQNLGIIHFPNNPGTSCAYIDQGIYLGGKQSREGLPTFITSYFNIADFTFQNQCFEDTTIFNITNVQLLDSARWTFDDPLSGAMNTSTQWMSWHVFTAPGTYDVELITYRDGLGDTISLPVEIYAYPDILLPTDTVFCLGSTIVLDAGVPGASYSWSNGASTQTISITPPDTMYYAVNVDMHGCESSDTITVYPYQITSNFTATQPPCANQPVTVNYTGNAAAGSTFNWNFGNATIISGSGSGPYTLSWTNPGNYQISLMVQQGQCNSPTTTNPVDNPDGIEVSLTANNVLCKGDATGEIFSQVDGNGGVTSYLWNTGANTQNLIGVPAGNYSLTVTYLNVCEVVDNIIVSEPGQALNLQVQGDNIVCNGESNGVVAAIPTGGTPPYSYLWDFNQSTTSSLQGLYAGYYPVTVTDSHLCTTSSGGTVIEPSPLEIFSAPDSYICPQEMASVSASAQGGQAPYVFNWSNGMIGETIFVSPSVGTTYQATVTDANGCKKAGAHSTVNVFPPVQTSIWAFRDTLCPGDSTIIYASFSGGMGGPYAAYFSDGTPAVAPFILTPASTQTISIYAMDECEKAGPTDHFTVTVVNNPTIDFSADELIGCQPFKVQFQNLLTQDKVEYLWHFQGNGENSVEFETHPEHVFEYAGVFDVILKGINRWGCESSKEIPAMIEVLARPEAKMFVEPSAVPASKPIVFFKNTTENYFGDSHWFFGDGIELQTPGPDATHIYADTGTFLAGVVSLNWYHPSDYPALDNPLACPDSALVEINVYGDQIFFAPNVIRPAGSNWDNAVFKPSIYGGVGDTYQLFIYNRWGEKIYETSDYHLGWNGYLRNGKIAPNGTYSWLIIYSDSQGTVFRKNGTVLLLD